MAIGYAKVPPPKCSNCHFYRSLTTVQGECHIGRPAIIYVEKKENGDLSYTGGWSPTKPDQWCGEHERQHTPLRGKEVTEL